MRQALAARVGATRPQRQAAAGCDEAPGRDQAPGAQVVGDQRLRRDGHAETGGSRLQQVVEVLEPLAEAMNLDFYRGNCLSIANGTLTGDLVGEIIDRAGKARALSDWAGQLSLASEQTVAVGDGANDLEMMQLAGLSVAFNAKEIVRSQADLVIDSGDLRDLLPALAHF